jgi:hypothetical protein
MWQIILMLGILALVCLITVREKMSSEEHQPGDLILVSPEEIINSNYLVYKNWCPVETKWEDNFVLARPLPTPTTRTRNFDYKSMIEDCVIRGYRCSLILENERKELYAYNQWTPVYLEYRVGYTTYVGYEPKTIEVDFLSVDSDIIDGFKVYKDFAPRYAILGTNGFFRSVEAAKNFCRKNNQNTDTGCVSFVHRKENDFITVNPAGNILYSSPGFDTYIAV